MTLSKLERTVSGAVMLLIGTIITACAPAVTPFNYDTATIEEQHAYLEELALPMEKKLKRAMISPSGVGPTFSVKGHKNIPQTRTIEFEIEISGRFQINSQFNQVKTGIMQSQCPQFVKGVFGRNDIKLRQKYISTKKATLATIVISKQACQPYL